MKAARCDIYFILVQFSSDLSLCKHFWSSLYALL